MIKYIIKRLFFFIPTLILISIISFLLTRWAPGDPVLSYMELDGEETVIDNQNPIFKNNYKKVFRELHLDKPVFYFSINSSNYPEDSEIFINVRSQDLYDAYLSLHYEYEDVIAVINSLESIERRIARKESKQIESLMDSLWNPLNRGEETDGIKSLISILKKNNIPDQQLEKHYKDLIENRSFISFPRLRWHGNNNQYHHWLLSFWNEKGGRSYIDGLPVMEKIKKSIKWTLMMILPALFLSFLISILIGVYNEKYQENKWMKGVNLLNYMIFSIPVFWLATMVLIISSSISFSSQGSFIRQSDSMWTHWDQLIWPIFVIVIHNIAYVSRQMFHSMIKQSKQDFIRTAHTKGVSTNKVIWKHQFPNALLPMITLMTAAFPTALSGSVVLELIFNIPGMGRLMYQALMQMDWPVVFGSLLFLSMVSLIFMLLGDVLYAFFNPKIRFDND